MIKLERAKKPAFLTEDKVNELTDNYKSTNKPVWNINKIKEPLQESSYQKCAYCECKLNRSGNYMEVEHFEDKNHNKDKVVHWDNLLPSCKNCNSHKGTHNVIEEPIINPYIDTPKDHLFLHGYRYWKKSSKGQSTIDVIDLNNYTRRVKSRFEFGETINKLIDDLEDKLHSYLERDITQRKNKLLGSLFGILEECQPQKEYSAICATCFFENPKIDTIIDKVQELALWDEELQKLYDNAKSITLLKEE